MSHAMSIAFIGAGQPVCMPMAGRLVGDLTNMALS